MRCGRMRLGLSDRGGGVCLGLPAARTCGQEVHFPASCPKLRLAAAGQERPFGSVHTGMLERRITP